MTIDIKEGDVLVIGALEYPVKAVAEYSGFMTTPTFQRQTTITASTKRSETASGKRATPTANLTSVRITPLDPVSATLATSMGLGTPHELKKCYCGDEDGFLQIILEDQKR